MEDFLTPEETQKLFEFASNPDGSELKQHHDQGYDLSLQRAVIIYLNDNYEGGEIYFTQHDVRLKPKAGSLITFPGTDDYLHGVATVQPGETRYVISTFAFNK